MYLESYHVKTDFNLQLSTLRTISFIFIFVIMEGRNALPKSNRW